jgi:hypothetical protein
MLAHAETENHEQRAFSLKPHSRQKARQIGLFEKTYRVPTHPIAVADYHRAWQL